MKCKNKTKINREYIYIYIPIATYLNLVLDLQRSSHVQLRSFPWMLTAFQGVRRSKMLKQVSLSLKTMSKSHKTASKFIRLPTIQLPS